MTKKKQFLRSLMVRGFVLAITLMVFGFFEGRPLVLAQDAKELLKRVDRLYRSDSSHAEMEMEVLALRAEMEIRRWRWRFLRYARRQGDGGFCATRGDGDREMENLNYFHYARRWR